jgi:hypothetical protein
MPKIKEETPMEYIEYGGSDGITETCLDAVFRYINYGDQINEVDILTYNMDHALLMRFGDGHCAFIRSGFSSGYSGEAPKGLALVIQIFLSLNVRIREYNVNRSFFKRVNAALIRMKDLVYLNKLKACKPLSYDRFVSLNQMNAAFEHQVWSKLKEPIPYALFDTRIADLVQEYREKPNDALLTGYKRLENILQAKFITKSFGLNLIKEIMDKKNSIWTPGISEGVQKGRSLLFQGCFSSFRNELAHNEFVHVEYGLSEFLLLNLLFLYEKDISKKIEDMV